MTSLRFLADECVPEELITALLQRAPAMDLIAVGKSGAPPKGTLDPDLLLVAESSGRAFLSRDRKTMPGHLADHFRAGHHTCGVLLLRKGFSLARFVQEILTIWQATDADDWIDATVYIPL